jgi:RNA polymerase sigma-70 factor (ECF subfamily)
MMVGIALVMDRPRVAREDRLRATVAQHYDVVWRFVRRMGVPEAGAEDVVQQVLVVLARKLDSVDAAKERSFLLGTALRVAADYRKQHARRREVSVENATDEPSHVLATDEELDRRRARRVLDQILDQLPSDLRSVFVMCDLEELSMAEAAASLDIPAGTVASRLKRAREAFGKLAAEARKRLAEERR